MAKSKNIWIWQLCEIKYFLVFDQGRLAFLLLILNIFLEWTHKHSTCPSCILKNIIILSFKLIEGLVMSSDDDTHEGNGYFLGTFGIEMKKQTTTITSKQNYVLSEF